MQADLRSVQFYQSIRKYHIVDQTVGYRQGQFSMEESWLTIEESWFPVEECWFPVLKSVDFLMKTDVELDFRGEDGIIISASAHNSEAVSALALPDAITEENIDEFVSVSRRQGRSYPHVYLLRSREVYNDFPILHVIMGLNHVSILSGVATTTLSGAWAGASIMGCMTLLSSRRCR